LSISETRQISVTFAVAL